MTIIETKELAAESQAALTVAQNFKVTTPQQYLDSGEKLKAIKALSKKIDDTFDPHIKRAFDAHRLLVAEKKQHQAPLQTAEMLIKRAIVAYQLEEERKRREIEARAQEEARKEREKLEAQAAKAAAKGKEERAAALAAAASAVVAPIIPTTTPKIAGLSTRVTYKAVVVDELALAEAVVGGRRKAQIPYQGPDRRVASRVPSKALEANMPFLNNQARAMKETLAYPGVRVEQDTGLSSRSA